MITTVFFDLDGTLLPMDQKRFIKSYFGRLARKMAPYGYDPQALIDAIQASMVAMVRNDGRITNEAAFWNCFDGFFDRDTRADIPVFEEFYRVEFQQVRQDCGFDPRAAETIQALHEMGLGTVLATNPMFPAIATQSRVRWAGLQVTDFALITTYEDCCYCKPNPDYYREILDKLGLPAEQCLMVGNATGEDRVAREVGMQVFRLTATSGLWIATSPPWASTPRWCIPWPNGSAWP